MPVFYMVFMLVIVNIVRYIYKTSRTTFNCFKSDKPVIVVPVKFIQKGASENYVLVAEKGKAVKKIIIIGKEYNGMAQVTDGLSEGDLLIVEGYDLINDGDSISIKK